MTVTDSRRRRALPPPRPGEDARYQDEQGDPSWALPNPARSRQGRRRLTIFALTVASDATAIAVSMVLGYLAMTVVRPPSHLVRPPDVFVLLPAYLVGFVVLRGYRQDPRAAPALSGV